MPDISPGPQEDRSNDNDKMGADGISIHSSGSASPVGSSSFEKGDIEAYPEDAQVTRTKSNVAKRILTRISTKSSWVDPGPPPDGGFKAWLQCAMGCMIVTTTW